MEKPKAWSLDHSELGLGGKKSFRPAVMGTHGMVSSGHYLSSLAGVRVLEEGGNAIDAGVAAAVAGSVLQSDFVSFGGVAAIQIYRADLGESFTIAGVGPWPALASLEHFRDQSGGHVPNDVRNGVVPGAPDGYLTALERFGSWSFGKAVGRAVELAEEGFPMFPFRYEQQMAHQEVMGQFPSTREVLWPGGRQPEPGEIFRQPELGRSLRLMADAEASAGEGDRSRGIQAARDVFYRGEIADRIDRFYRESGGFLRKSDMAGYRAAIDPPMVGSWKGYEIRTCPFWSKGPMLIQLLNLLEGYDLSALGHNSAEYIHLVAEALTLVFADRHAYYGDPLVVEVPAEGLLSKEYAVQRRRLIDGKQAWTEMPPAGDPWSGAAVRGGKRDEPIPGRKSPREQLDTSYLAVVDRWGNFFGATFSDPFMNSPIVPGTGMVISNRGIQAFVDPDHPNRVRPGQRPVVTPNPAMVFKDGKPVLALGSPGSDVQVQAMLQVLLNVLEFGMDPQRAVEEPRFATYNHPSSFEPHTYLPGVLRVEARIQGETMGRLEELDHRVESWQAWQWQAGGVCAITYDPETGLMAGGADSRRENYVIGW